MARLHLLAGSFVLLAGCAAAPPPRRSAPLAADLEAWVSSGARAGTSARTSTLAPARPDEEAPRVGVVAHRIVPPPSLPPRPVGRSRVDVRFQDADMVNAFQFLADAGRFNLVLQDGLTGKVSATLHGVDPYDALVSLAEANGASVRFDRQIVVVQKR